MIPETLEEIIARIKRRADALAPDYDADPALVDSRCNDATRERNEIEQVLASWGVPKRHLDCLRAPLQTAAIRHVDAWSASSRVFLVLAGGVGTGKSVAAAHWLALAARGVQPAPGFIRRWWGAVDISRLSMFDEKWNALGNCARLIIDDIGAEYTDGKGAFITSFGDLINKRYEHKLKTVITTNISGEKFIKRYGQRTADRILHDGLWANIPGASMRASIDTAT